MKTTIKHELVPTQEKISSEEKEKILTKIGISFKDLPKIHRDDPSLTEMDVKNGDIIKITRKSFTAKETVFYRGVIDA